MFLVIGYTFRGSKSTIFFFVCLLCEEFAALAPLERPINQTEGHESFFSLSECWKSIEVYPLYLWIFL